MAVAVAVTGGCSFKKGGMGGGRGLRRKAGGGIRVLGRRGIGGKWGYKIKYKFYR